MSCVPAGTVTVGYCDCCTLFLYAVISGPFILFCHNGPQENSLYMCSNLCKTDAACRQKRSKAKQIWRTCQCKENPHPTKVLVGGEFLLNHVCFRFASTFGRQGSMLVDFTPKVMDPSTRTKFSSPFGGVLLAGVS